MKSWSRDSPLNQLPSNRSEKNSHSSIIMKIDGNRWQIIERSDKKWRLRGDDRSEQHRSLNTKNPRDGPAQRRRKTKNRRRTPPTTSNARPRFLRKKSSSETRDAGSFIRDLAGVHAHAYQSSCPRTNQQEQEIKERVKRAWKENRKGGRLLESLRLETSSVFDWGPWAVRSERNETGMSLEVSWLYTR